MKQHRRLEFGLIACAVLAAAGFSVPATAADLSDVKFTWGGYIKLDTLYSHFSDGPVAQGTGRDTYIPNQIPVVASATEDSHSYLDFHAKETRLFLNAESLIEGHKIGGRIEFDFIVNQGAGSETATNAYNPGLRRAYITFDNWLFGQDWSTFENLTALPESLDFVAFPTDGTVFVRQPMIRYTNGGWVFALENPESTVAVNAGGPAFANTDDSKVYPDAVVRYNFKMGNADLTVAGLVRQIVDQGSIGGAKDTAVGYGGTFSGKIPVGAADDVRFMVSGGDGIGRYLALNTVGDAVLDTAGKLKTISIVNGYLAYHHPWTSQWRSNLGLSHFSADTKSGDLAGSTTEKVSSAFLNLLYSPVSRLTLGAELRQARRETAAKLDGDLSRLQLSAKYSF